MGVINDQIKGAARHWPEASPQDAVGELVLPPGLGEEFPELLLPMTPDRAVDFERRSLNAPPASPQRYSEW